jgi:disulfide bond formation protein DsbB
MEKILSKAVSKKAEKTKATLSFTIRNDISGENEQRNARQNPDLANSINAIGWLGAILLALAPLFSVVVWCSLAIFGLALLTVQATYNKVNNLIALNIFSIITLSIKLIGITQ